MDTQLCALDIVPFPRADQIKPQWVLPDVIQTATEPAAARSPNDEEMSSLSSNCYNLIEQELTYLRADDRAMIRVYFTFERQLLPAFLSIYFPSTLIVIVT